MLILCQNSFLLLPPLRLDSLKYYHLSIPLHQSSNTTTTNLVVTRSLDRYIVDVRDGDMRDFCLQDESDVIMEDQYGIGPTHREGY
jgi:hypothetical protein